jgi:hypothetical protein
MLQVAHLSTHPIIRLDASVVADGLKIFTESLPVFHRFREV